MEPTKFVSDKDELVKDLVCGMTKPKTGRKPLLVIYLYSIIS